jgi:hypothetical protein
MHWSSDTETSTGLVFVHEISDAKNSWEEARTNEKYFDVHNWRFTPASFRLLLGDLRTLELTGFEIKMEFDTTGCEFYVTLGKKIDNSSLKGSNRMELLKRIKEDDESIG